MAVIVRARVMDWSELLTAAHRLANAEEPWVSASEASEYGLDLLAAAEFPGLTEQRRKILLVHGEMWLTQPRWSRGQLLGLLRKQLSTYLLFGLDSSTQAQLERILGDLELKAAG